MGPLDTLFHLLSFIAPAAAVGLSLAVAARLRPSKPSPGTAVWVQFALNTAVGVAVLVAGLWYFGVDGKMATYAALVLATATCQWWGGRKWRA